MRVEFTAVVLPKRSETLATVRQQTSRSPTERLWKRRRLSETISAGYSFANDLRCRTESTRFSCEPETNKRCKISSVWRCDAMLAAMVVSDWLPGSNLKIDDYHKDVELMKGKTFRLTNDRSPCESNIVPISGHFATKKWKSVTGVCWIRCCRNLMPSFTKK